MAENFFRTGILILSTMVLKSVVSQQVHTDGCPTHCELINHGYSQSTGCIWADQKMSSNTTLALGRCKYDILNQDFYKLFLQMFCHEKFSLQKNPWR